jgi:8-oxo-dGTP pyrophosphatase MutT (NUDIX family)
MVPGVAMSPFLRQLRETVGNDLLLLPSVAVLPWDQHGRLLLVRNVETGRWEAIGGIIEPDEPPREAAIREAREEAGVELELTGLRDVTGGPQYRHTYPNGHQVSIVSVVFDARVIGGSPRGDGDETSDARWWELERAAEAGLNPYTRALLTDVAAWPGPPEAVRDR